MQNGNNSGKEPKDSVRKKPNDQIELQDISKENAPQDNISHREISDGEPGEHKILITDEEDQKVKSEIQGNEFLVNQAVQEKSIQTINFSNELDSILASLNIMWEKNRDGFDNYYQTDIIPKINEFLSYPCITAIQEKIFLIFRFLCKYFLTRKNYLKEMPLCELFEICIILYNNQVNIFSKTPNNVQNYELIDDRIFYMIFKELLPNKEIENSFANSNRNCMYKYFVEFLFQIGFNDSYIDIILNRDDLSPGSYVNVSFLPFYLLNFYDRAFMIQKNYNIKMIKIFNSKIDFFLSEKNPYIKNDDEMLKINIINNFFIDMLFGVFNHVLDELKINNNIDCEIFCINVFKISEYFLKDQKIKIRICGIYLASYLCNIYKNFSNNYQEYRNKYNDIEKIYFFAVNCAILYLNKMEIFHLIFGENIHEGVIQRAYPILSFLYKNKSFSREQIQDLWNLSQRKYLSISDSIITLFGQLLPEFSNEDCNRILNIVSKMDYKNVNETTLKLLENFFFVNEKRELLLDILFKFSNESACEKGLEKNIINKSREILVKLFFNKKYIDDLINYMKNCIFYIKKFYLVNTYLTTLSQIFEEFDKMKNNNSNVILKEIFNKLDKNIEDFGLMISYFDNNYKLFPILFNCLIKIIKVYKFCNIVSINIIDQISQGNFEYEQLLNIDNLYNDYKKFINQNMNFSYILCDDNNNNGGDMDLDFEGNNNQIFNINQNEEEVIIKEIEYDNYIKNIIKDFVIFFNKTFISNILPSKYEIKREIFEKLKLFFENFNYYDNIKNILRIIYFTHIRGNIHFNIKYLNFLFNIGQNTQDIDPSIEWYFNLLYDLFSSQINSSNNLKILKDENLEYLIKEHILKSDFKCLPVSAFNAFNIFCIYANQKNGYAIYSPLIQKYTEIKNYHNFFGFEIILQFFLYTKNMAIYNQALNILMNIIELTSQNIESRNKYNYYIFNYIEKNKNNIQSNQEIKLAIIRNLKLISVVNGAKNSKNIFDNKNDKNLVELIIKNFYFSSKESSDNISKIKITKDIKIKNLKEYIINEIICTENNLNLHNQKIKANNNLLLNENNNLINIEDNNTISITNGNNTITLENPLSSIEDLKKEVYKTNILINYKNKTLQDEYSLADYNIEKDSNLVILKGSGHFEEEYKPTEEELKNGYEAIKMVFNENLYFNEEVMKASIIKHKGNYEDAALYLTIPENVKNLEKEIENKKKRVEQKDEDIICLELKKINLLIEVLNNDDPEISRNIWELFSEIKYPEELVNKIKEEEFEKILAENNINRMILYLKIINSLIFGDNFCKYNKLEKEEKSNWISIFIKKDNIISRIFITLSTINKKMSNHNQIYKIINIFINWYYKIILKIEPLLKTENRNNLLGVKLLHQFNLQNNININNNNENEKENQEKKLKEFELINKEEANNFIANLYKINCVEHFYKILGVLIDLNIKPEEKLIIIENIYEIFISFIILQPESIPQLSNIEKDNNILINIICKNTNNQISLITKNFIQALLSTIISFTDKKELDNENNIYNIFCLSFINKIINGYTFNEYFYELLGSLLVFQTNKLIQNLIEPLINTLLNHVYDLCSNFNQYDNLSKKNITYETYILYCCVKFYKDILKKYINKMLIEEKKDFLELIFNCLFEIPKDKAKINSFKFTDEFLRKHSFQLLYELIISDEKYLFKLLPKVLIHHKKLKEFDPNKCQIPFDVNLRSPKEKFVGLRNFGCTCYLNSLFQQMFMIPTFRHDILNTFIFKNNNIEDEYKYSVLYNMQITFLNLIIGIMSPYPPIRFIKSFLSAFNGQPIQLGLMQDSDEFLGILCDNLEKEAKNFGAENFLEQSFKGKISNEILSQEKEFPYYSQSEEPFYRITLDIKGHKTLEEALDAYIKGEILDGDNKYYVEQYKRKISIRKSSSLKKLGNEVIIHLKRFEYDFITFTNKKLNDYIKFPKTINFKKWTRAFLRLKDNNIEKGLLNITEEEERNLNDDNMDYILTGILIHGGSNLESGHYYSFIMDQETGKWHQFNDNIISDYNIENDLEKECFGNLPEQNDPYGKTAYLLFYTNKKCFKKKELLEANNINENLLNEVYNENSNFLNLKIFTNLNYLKFIIDFSNFGSNLLDDELYFGNQKNITMNNYLKKQENIYYKVQSVIKGDEDDNDDDSIDENYNDENDITNKPNFEQIYIKCKEEIEVFSIEEKNKKKNIINKNYTKKNIIKLYFNYLFGIVFPYLNKNQNILTQGLQNLNNILKNNTGYSLWILKQIEKNLDVFTDILFKFGTTENEMNDLNKTIIEFFQITFDTIFNYEREMFQSLLEEVKYFAKNDQGKYIITKEYKSIIMRLIKKLFCENLEKSRIEYAKSSLFLIIFYNFVKAYPEISSICDKYLLTIISLITNNSLLSIKSETNPNYFMGNTKNYDVNNNYILIFSDIILHCATPGMENTKSYSPYFTGRKKIDSNNSYIDFSKYPHLPKNWENMISIEFFIQYVLSHSYFKKKEIICHLCYGDEKTSVKILSIINAFIRSKNTLLTFMEKVFNNTLNVFELKDALVFIRLDTLFQLNDDKNSENKEPIDTEEYTLFEYYYEIREKNIFLVLYMLYNIGKAMEKYEIISQYFIKYKNKLEWIKYFLIELKSDPKMKEDFIKNNTFIMNHHPDLMKVIQESIIKRFGFDSY